MTEDLEHPDPEDLDPEQLLAAYGSHLVERAYILSLERRCTEIREQREQLEANRKMPGEEWDELEREETLVCNAHTCARTLFLDHEYLTQE